MKTIITICLGLFFSAGLVLAGGKPNPNPQAVISYTFVKSNGTNASAIAWNKSKKLYYAVIAGNSSYPLETFDANGKSISQREAGADFRGLWFNKKTKGLQGNLASAGGWVNVACDKGGIPTGNPGNFVNGEKQPTVQSVGAFDEKGKEVIFYSGGSIYRYDAQSGTEKGSVELRLPTSASMVNGTTAGFTGVKNYEYVLLDHSEKQLLFFNRSCEHTGVSQLPNNAPTYEVFRFSFANGIAFLYSADARKWTGYKVF